MSAGQLDYCWILSNCQDCGARVRTEYTYGDILIWWRRCGPCRLRFEAQEAAKLAEIMKSVKPRPRRGRKKRV